jgi:tetratricopeptide (TPR) repeat protein
MFKKQSIIDACTLFEQMFSRAGSSRETHRSTGQALIAQVQWTTMNLCFRLHSRQRILAKEVNMFSIKLPAAALAGIGAIVSGAYGGGAGGMQGKQDIDPKVLLGIDGAVCRNSTGAAANGKLFFKLAAASSEFKPFGQLPQQEQQNQQQQASGSSDEPPLWNNLGNLSYRITTGKPLAQKYFNQGLRLNYAFNHEEAARAFRMAQKIDPGCAMCYWGEALVLGPNINMPMDENAIAPAVAASDKAMSLADRTSRREQALINALAMRYSGAPAAERKKLDAAYAEAMGKVAARYPNDQDIGVLHAESLMNLSPWDYWEAGGARPKGRTAELVATLERVLKANPNHPGAIHYYIHTVEASTTPKRAEPYAERLGKLMPGAGHVVHMPSHIYYRVGRYRDSLTVNKQAVAVDEAYIAEQKPPGVYPVAYYPHNVHFVLASAQMAGDGKTAIDAADKLAALVTDDLAREFVIAQPVKVAPYFAHAQFSDPETILRIAEPAAGLPYVEGIWRYARGVAFARKGDVGGARREADAIEKLRQSGDFAGLTEALIPAKDALQIAHHVLEARIAQSQADYAGAAGRFEKAAALEEQLSYMEPPYWYYPVRQSLGAALLQQGDLDNAEQAFRASLNRTPNNGWALYGLSEVYKKRGDAKRVSATEALLGKAWAGDREQLELARL